MQYLLAVLISRFGAERMLVRNLRELRTLATALDLLVDGRLAQIGDLLVQRMKAIEIAIAVGQWYVAQHHELIPPMDSGLVSPSERAVTAHSELQRLRVADAVGKTSGRSSADR